MADAIFEQQYAAQMQITVSHCSSPNGMLVYRRVTFSIFPVLIYTPGWREALWELSITAPSQWPGCGSSPDPSIWSPARALEFKGKGYMHTSQVAHQAGTYTGSLAWSD